jgi:inositol-phosphate phosphatase/L-galactose 1-phosphate phosphatase/histidinol-phosphatase
VVGLAPWNRTRSPLSQSLSDRALDGFVAFANELADVAHAMLTEAGRLRPEREVKPDRSFVTQHDIAIETRLRELIDARFPGHGVLGEEAQPRDADADLVWVLDPIDGTAPFIAGAPVYGTLIALAAEGVPVLGIIDQAVTGDRWIGAQGRPTRHGAHPCRSRQSASLGGSILTCSNPDFFAPEERPALDALRGATAWRIYGTACMAYGLLASGRTDLALDTGFKVHDFAPFVPIVTGAGGRITDWDGAALTLASGPRILAAGSADRHAEALALVRRAMDETAEAGRG